MFTELSRSPQINKLVHALQDHAIEDDDDWPEVSHPTYEMEIPRVRTSFATLQDILQQLDGAEAATTASRQGLVEQLLDTLASLLASFDRLAARESQDPEFAFLNEAARTRSCPRCGASNYTTDAHCKGCQTKLPRLDEGLPTAVDVYLEDSLQQVGHHRLNPLTRALCKEVHGVQTGDQGWTELRDALTALDQRVDMMRNHLEQVDLQQAQGPEEIAATQWAHDLMQDAVRDMASGRQASTAETVERLEVGLESFLDGADKMVQEAGTRRHA